MTKTSFTSGSNSTKQLIILIFATCLITSCGGGEGDSTEVEPPPIVKTDWDDINWDQNDWQ